MRLGAFLVFLVYGLSTVVQGQDGYGGYGGGFGGNAGGDGREVESDLLLTPGDKTVYVFEAKENEAIEVHVRSASFDPAVAIYSQDKKLIASNDDAGPGRQNAQLLVLPPHAGKYEISVYNYKGTSGGQFHLSVRLHKVQRAQFGELVNCDKASDGDLIAYEIDEACSVVLAFQSSLYSVPSLRDAIGNNIGPDRRYDAFDPLVNHRRRWGYDLKEPGIFFSPVPRLPGSIRLTRVRRFTGKIGETVSGELGPDEVQEWSVPLEAGDNCQGILLGENSQATFANTDGATPPEILNLFGNAISPTIAVHCLQKYVFVFSVWDLDGKPGPYRLELKNVGTPLRVGETKSKLPWFGAEYWTHDVSAGDLLTVSIQADNCEVGARLVGPDGSRGIFRNVGRSPMVSASIATISGGTYTLAVGGKGAGAYTIHCQVTSPRRLKLGELVGECSVNVPQTWCYSAKTPQDLILRTESNALNCRLAWLTREGKVVTEAVHQAGASTILRLACETGVDYVLIVIPMDGANGKYQLKLVDLNR